MQLCIHSTKTSIYTLLVFVLLTAAAAGLLYAQVATGDLDDKARTETIKKSASSEAPKQQQVVGDEPRKKVYSKLRTDRSGAAIHDMLYAHAYAFANGMQYMGACPAVYYLADQQILLNALGLNSTLPIACPPGETSNRVFLEGRNYLNDSYLRNEQWLKYIRSVVRRAKPGSDDGDNVMQVAVHIRRGDVTPCPRKKHFAIHTQLAIYGCLGAIPSTRRRQ